MRNLQKWLFAQYSTARSLFSLSAKCNSNAVIKNLSVYVRFFALHKMQIAIDKKIHFKM